MFISCINLILTHDQGRLLGGQSQPSLFCAAARLCDVGMLTWPRTAQTPHYLTSSGCLVETLRGLWELVLEAAQEIFDLEINFVVKLWRKFARGSSSRGHRKCIPQFMGETWAVCQECLAGYHWKKQNKLNSWLCDHMSAFWDSSVLLTTGSLAICVKTIRALCPQSVLSRPSQPIISFCLFSNPAGEGRYRPPSSPGGDSTHSF